MKLFETQGDPYSEGFNAFNNGLGLSESNYVPESPGEYEWCYGWRDAYIRKMNESSDNIDEDITYDDDDQFFLEQGWFAQNPVMFEAMYQGKKVELNKPTRGDVKRFKVYVNSGKKDDEGNIIAKKVNFGSEKGSDLKVKKNDPEARKSFIARHKCDTADDPTTARYWSCRGAMSTSNAKYW